MLTPSRMSARSGLITTLPVPLTLMVCSVAPAGSVASEVRGPKNGPAIAAMRRPAASPAASQRARGPGTGTLIEIDDEDMGVSTSLLRGANSHAAPRRLNGPVWFLDGTAPPLGCARLDYDHG